MSDLEEQLLAQLAGMGVPAPEREVRFCDTRRWRADLCWADARLLVEVEGGIWVGGRHTRAAGYSRDTEKYNAATLLGWRLLRYTTQQVRDGSAAREIAGAYEKWGAVKPSHANVSRARKGAKSDDPT